jgi:Leucine-rich repeat (LRR) protein
MKLSRLLPTLAFIIISMYSFGQTRQQDSLALVALYNATDGASWTRSDNWRTGNLDTWFGITLNASQRVNRINMPSNNLSGVLPDSLGNLTGLRWIFLNGNNLNGSVPNTINNLPALNTLDVSDNLLNGDLPSMSGMSDLEQFSLKNNRLAFSGLGSSGIFPGDIEILEYAPQDTILAIYSNIIDGTIWVEIDNDAENQYKWYKNGDAISGSDREIVPPGEGAYTCDVTNASFPGLTLTSATLNFGYTEKSDSVALVVLYNATHGAGWANSTNWLTGNLSTWFGVTVDGNGRVTELDLANNNLDGILPDELTNLSELVSLKVGGNKLRGNLPQLSLVTSLDTLWIDKNRFMFFDLSAAGIKPGDIASYIYQPQDTIVPLSFNTFESLLTVTDGVDTNNVYSWYLEGSMTEDTTRTIVVDMEGFYNCEITNSVFIALTLLTDTLEINFSSVTDSLALVNLYNETNGAQWTNRTNWLTGPMQTWFGITCDTGNRVMKVLLPHNKLNGTIPVQIGTLNHLTQLNLSNNQLSGIIPDEIERVAGLTLLNLYGNQLTGIIPAGIGDLTDLAELGLHFNQLSGAIPSRLFNAANLQSLKLANNQFTGTIPAGIDNLSKLTWLALNDNQLTGSIPTAIGSLPLLNGIALDGNDFSGNIPTEIGNLTNLIHLSLDDNTLSGTIPAMLGNCTHLNYLSLAGNQLTGTIPVGITTLSGLTELLLGGNQLSGEIPAGIGILTSLNNLDLAKNRFTGSLPAQLENLTGLISLNLDSNQFTGDLPLLSNATYLSEVSVDNNQFTFSNLISSDILPADVGQFDYAPQDTIFGLDYDLIAATLTVVDDDEDGNEFAWFRDTVLLDETSKTIPLTLEGNYFCRVNNPLFPDLTIPSDTFAYSYTLVTDSVSLVAFYDSTSGAGWTTKTNWKTGTLDTWFGVTLSGGRVSSLVLNSNNLDGTLPPGLGNLTHLSILQLQNNLIDGSIPVEIGEIDSLSDLRLNNNQLTGVIPTVISNLTKLKTLYLNNNLLSGIIPVGIGNLTGLTYLALHSNQLTGNIPSGIGTLTNLQILNLGFNQLSGTLPSAIGNLAALQSLYLSNNSFSGSIPAALGNLSAVRNINLSGNGFSGQLPVEFGNLGNVRNLNLAGNNFSGAIPEDIGYLSSLQELYIGDNAYHFNAIEPIFGWPNYSGFQAKFTYSPQEAIGVVETVQGIVGQSLVFGISNYISAESDRFQWYKNDVLQTGKTDSVFIIPSFAVSDLGVYHCVVTNTIATALTLTSNDITVEEYDVPENQTLTNLSVGSGQSPCYDALQDITVAGSGTTVNLLSGSSVTFIAGNSIRFLPGFHAFSGSNVDAHITTTASFCEPVQNIVYNELIKKSVAVPEKETAVTDKAVDLKIYPNPNNGRFTIEMKGFAEGAMLSVLDMKGRVVSSKLIHGTHSTPFYIQAIEKGIYFIRVSDGTQSLNRKMVVW